MIADQIVKLRDIFPRRLLLNALLPTFVITTADAVVLSMFTGSWASITAWWRDTDGLTRIVAVMGYLATAWFLGTGVASQWRGIVRIYEGYPLVTAVRWVNGHQLRLLPSGKVRQLRIPVPGIEWHKRQLDYLRNNTDDSYGAYIAYPKQSSRELVLPTRLGNILLAAERYPMERYGIESIAMWPRLYPLLPSQFQQDYEEFVANYELPLVVSFLSACSGVVLGAGALWSRQEPLAYVLALILPLAVAYLGYVLSLSSAEEMAEQQRTAFDLYRGRLLHSWPTVDDVLDEKEAFESISDFVLADAPPNWRDAQRRHDARLRRRGHGPMAT